MPGSRISAGGASAAARGIMALPHSLFSGAGNAARLLPSGGARGTGKRQDGQDLYRFGHPESSGQPNNWLVAPPDVVSAEADQTAPVFDRPPDQLAKAWIAVIEKQPRTTVLGISKDGFASRGAAAECGFRLHRTHQRPVRSDGTGALHPDRLQPIAHRLLGPGRQPQPISAIVDRAEEGTGRGRVSSRRSGRNGCGEPAEQRGNGGAALSL